jgi:hypothetical protein
MLTIRPSKKRDKISTLQAKLFCSIASRTIISIKRDPSILIRRDASFEEFILAANALSFVYDDYKPIKNFPFERSKIESIKEFTFEECRQYVCTLLRADRWHDNLAELLEVSPLYVSIFENVLENVVSRIYLLALEADQAV